MGSASICCEKEAPAARPNKSRPPRPDTPVPQLVPMVPEVSQASGNWTKKVPDHKLPSPWSEATQQAVQPSTRDGKSPTDVSRTAQGTVVVAGASAPHYSAVTRHGKSRVAHTTPLTIAAVNQSTVGSLPGVAHPVLHPRPINGDPCDREGTLSPGSWDSGDDPDHFVILEHPTAHDLPGGNSAPPARYL